MSKYTHDLSTQAQALFSDSELQNLTALTSGTHLDYVRLVSFDLQIGGPGIATISHQGIGRYHVTDRDIFRPLQYCARDFESGCKLGDLAWRTRNIVLHSSNHVESLVKRISGVEHFPLGQALHRPLARMKIDTTTWKQTDRFTRIYNASKHEFKQPKDTHLFSVEDAVLAYSICRRLGSRLYPLATLTTDLRVFEKDDAEINDN